MVATVQVCVLWRVCVRLLLSQGGFTGGGLSSTAKAEQARPVCGPFLFASLSLAQSLFPLRLNKALIKPKGGG